MAETVERSKQTVGSLESSSKTVEELQEEHKMMGGVIGQSRRLITKYGRREFTDKVLIIFALAFFFGVVLYILRKRLFPSYGPIEAGPATIVSNLCSLSSSRLSSTCLDSLGTSSAPSLVFGGPSSDLTCDICNNFAISENINMHLNS